MSSHAKRSIDFAARETLLVSSTHSLSTRDSWFSNGSCRPRLGLRCHRLSPLFLLPALKSSRLARWFSRPLGRIDEAVSMTWGVQDSTPAILPTVLLTAVSAIAASKSKSRDVIALVGRFEERALSLGVIDFLVTAWRSTPELLPIMLRASREPDRLGRLLRQVGDDDLAIAAGLERQAPLDPKSRLTPREREVHDLLAHGLTNLQIAELLFIGESTVKVHVHHIYDKLGIRSRTAIAVQAALERADQATSATGTAESDRDS